MAYASNETGNMEIYVSPFPNATGKWQVSSGGGQEPKWRPDGKEFFYVSADGKMTAVAVKTGVSFEIRNPPTQVIPLPPLTGSCNLAILPSFAPPSLRLPL